MQKRIMIVEDSVEMQLLYKAIFRKESDLVIVAQEYSAEGVLDRIPLTKPDLIILDVTLGPHSGIDLARNIHEKYPAVKLLLITGHEVERFMQDAIAAGADGVLSKSEDTITIRNTLRKLLSIEQS